jgi:serine/threonine-protein kinase
MIGLKRGDVLLDKYRVEREIGKGGMGVVVCARHIALDDRVAIKLLLPEALRDRDNVARFIREARAARQIRSEHVAQVFDVGTLPTGEYYIIMEHLEGSDLAKVRRKQKVLPTEEVVDYVLQACEALAEAHAKGIVHRDLKPGNLFLTRRADGSPLIKVLDFGVSKLNDHGAVGLDFGRTRTGMVLGTPSYMAPEQITSPRAVDARADIWALGVILYFLITGELPFTSDSLGQVLLSIMNSEPAAPRSIRPDLPEALEAVILRCLEKGPENRYQNVAALVSALEPFAPPGAAASVERISRVLGVSVNVKPVKGGTLNMPAGKPLTAEGDGDRECTETETAAHKLNTAAMSAWDRTLAGLRSAMRTTSSLIGVAVLCAILLGLAVVLTLRRNGSTSPEPSAAAPVSSNSSVSPAVVSGPTSAETPAPSVSAAPSSTTSEDRGSTPAPTPSSPKRPSETPEPSKNAAVSNPKPTATATATQTPPPRRPRSDDIELER